MAEPVYTPTTERFYATLPEYMRLSDSRNDWTLKRWVSCIVDQLGYIDLLVDRIDYVGPEDGGGSGDTSDLTDPMTADEEWLPWLAQLVGVQIGALTLAEKRDAIRLASSGWKVGTKQAIADAARSALTGTKHVEVYDHSDATQIGSAGQWDVLIVTRTEETPDIAAVLATVIRKRAKPAGVKLHHRVYTSNWNQISAVYITWDDYGTTTNWRTIEETGL